MKKTLRQHFEQYLVHFPSYKTKEMRGLGVYNFMKKSLDIIHNTALQHFF